MKKLMQAAAVTLMLGLSTILAAADASGKWVAEVAGRDGATMKQTYVLKADGNTLTGTVSGRMGETPIENGKVDGDSISFEVTRKMRDNNVTIKYSGKVDGDSLKLTWTGPNGNSREVTAKREN